MRTIVTKSGPDFETVTDAEPNPTGVEAKVPITDIPNWNERFAEEIDKVLASHFAHYFAETEYKFIEDFCKVARKDGALDTDSVFDYLYDTPDVDGVSEAYRFNEDVADKIFKTYEDDVVPELKALEVGIEIPWSNIAYVID